MFRELADRRIAGVFGCIMLASMLFALSRAHVGWYYVVPTTAGPMLGWIYLLVRPLNPYRSLYARIEGMESEQSCSALRLVNTLASPEARWLAFKTGLVTAAALGTIGVLMCWSRQEPPTWSANGGAVLALTLMFAVTSLLVYTHVLMRWAFRTWSTTDRACPQS